MNTLIDRLVLVTNGSAETRPCLEYGAWLAQKLKVPVMVLAVREPGDQEHPVSALMGEFLPSLKSAGVDFQLENLDGNSEDLADRTVQKPGTVMVLGPLGRHPLRRFFLGRSFRHFMEDQLAPILYVPLARLPIRKILVCMGGLGYAMDVFHQALAITLPLHASLTFLHVVEPVTLDYPLAQEVETHWKDLLNTDTPQGRILKQALAESKEAGIEPELHLRHGHIVPEILQEIESGNYDLVCMGSIHSSHSLRHLSQPNVTAEIAENAHCPVLVVRSQVQATP